MNLTKQQTQLIGSLAAFARKGESVSVIGDGATLSFYGTGLNLCARFVVPSDLVVDAAIPEDAAKLMRTAREGATLTDALTVSDQTFDLIEHDSPPGWRLWGRVDDAHEQDVPQGTVLPTSLFSAIAKLRTSAVFSIGQPRTLGQDVVVFSAADGGDIDVMAKSPRR